MKWTVFALALVVAAATKLAWPNAGGSHKTQPPSAEERRIRSEVLASAKVFRSQPFDAKAIDFSHDPNSGLIDTAFTTCRFVPTRPTGTTPKFDCELPNGEKIKVKYGWTAEIPAELAATRLLHALGFGADHMSRVEKVRCFGCGFAPFHMRLVMQRLALSPYVDRRINYDRFTDFADVAVERKVDGESIDTGDVKGWAFYELSSVDPSRGGATRAEVDALRLMAMFLNHWDNKAENQRLICVDSKSAKCEHPLAMIQDTGSDFGPSKMNLAKWWHTPVWADSATCTLSMKGFPWDGATFQDVQISEEGRRLLAGRLNQLSPQQIETLFTASGFSDVPQWVAAFQERVRQVSERGSCPSRLSAS